MNIDWTLPERRKGFGGIIDAIIGPGATGAEKWVQFAPAFAFAAGVVSIAMHKGFDWTVLQYVLVVIFAVDMVGGAITNMTSAAKRWVFREGEGFKAHITFIGMHIVQISLLSLGFLGFDLMWIATVYGFVMVSCAVILKSPLYLQRLIAALLFAIGVLLALYVFESPEHLEWFLPILFFKLIVSHALREEPYQP